MSVKGIRVGISPPRDKTRRRLLIQQAQGLPNWCKCVATRVWNGREERLHPTKGWKRV